MKELYYFPEDIGEDPIENEINECDILGLEHELIKIDEDGTQFCSICHEVFPLEDDEDMSECYTAEEWEVLSRQYYGYPKTQHEDTLDAFKHSIYAALKPLEMSNVTVYIKKKAFDKLRQIAMNVYLYKSAEAAAVLYGKNNVIKRVKKYNGFESAGLVSSKAEDVVKTMNHKRFMGFFHSHLFGSASPSGIDKNTLSGWTCYCTKPVYSLIGATPFFKQRAWSMNDKLEMIEHPLEIL